MQKVRETQFSSSKAYNTLLENKSKQSWKFFLPDEILSMLEGEEDQVTSKCGQQEMWSTVLAGIVIHLNASDLRWWQELCEDQKVSEGKSLTKNMLLQRSSSKGFSRWKNKKKFVYHSVIYKKNQFFFLLLIRLAFFEKFTGRIIL